MQAPGRDAVLEARAGTEKAEYESDDEEFGEESDDDLDEDEEYGADSLQKQMEHQVMCRLSQSCQSMGEAFVVGGSLGCFQVALGVSCAPGRTGKRARSSLVPLSFGGEEQDAEVLLGVLRSACSEGPSTASQHVLTIPAERIFPQFDLAEHHQVLDTSRRLLSPHTPGGLAAKLVALRVCLPAEEPAPSQGTQAEVRLLSEGLPPAHSTSVGTLLVCLPLAHVGGELRVVKNVGSKGSKGSKSGRSRQSMAYSWGGGAGGGEVQWVAFLSGCSATMLPPAAGACVMMVYDLLAPPGAPLATSAVASNVATLARELSAALSCPGFMASGDCIGYPCRQRYPQSLVEGSNEEAARGMLAGGDAAVAQALSTLGVPWTLQRVWDVKFEDSSDEEDPWAAGDGAENDLNAARDRGVVLSKVLPGLYGDECPPPGGMEESERLPFLMENMGAELDYSISWLGGVRTNPHVCMFNAGWCTGASGRSLGGMTFDGYIESTLAIVADVPPFHQRQQLGSIGWAGKVS